MKLGISIILHCNTLISVCHRSLSTVHRFRFPSDRKDGTDGDKARDIMLGFKVSCLIIVGAVLLSGKVFITLLGC